MTKQIYTPGPWKKVFLNSHWHIARTDGRVEIAKVTAYKRQEVSTANALLIGAAPDLLEACKATWEAVDEWASEREPDLEEIAALREQARAAINKAEGA